MKEINRFYIMGNKLPLDDGPPVSFKDHAAIVAVKDALIAALQEQVRALAAEAESLREQSEEVYAAGYNHGHLNTVDGIAYEPGTKDDFYPNALQVMAEAETPATEAALREIRAQGAIEARNALVVACDGADIYAVVTDVAARIRAGEQP